MAYTAELKIDGKTFPVIRCEYSLWQQADLFGKPVPKVFNRPISLEIHGTDDETNISWALNNKKTLSGSIAFYKNDQSVFKEIKFEDGFCIKYKELVSITNGSTSGTSYRHYLEISPKSITIGDIKHDNHW
jgi:hypothetical protein